MPEISRPGFREFLPSANQALAELEEATGKPVQIVEDPQLNVLATIRRAGAGEASHVLRIKGGENQAADYLIVFECRMALRDGPGPRSVLRDNPAVREQVIRDLLEGMAGEGAGAIEGQADAADAADPLGLSRQPVGHRP